MKNLTAFLAGQLADQIENQHACLRAAAHRIADAETLAQRLSSAGIPASAFGRLDSSHILVWVTASPATPERIDAALTKLGLVESNRHPGITQFEIRLQGMDVPLYVMTPSLEGVDVFSTSALATS